MQIAVTSDTHLTSGSVNPERLAALGRLFGDVLAGKIFHLVIAGDCFNEGDDPFQEFDSLCSRPEHQKLQVMLIPGNHDSRLDPRYFVSRNIRVIREPELIIFENGFPLLFIPYQYDKTMGEILAAFSDRLVPREWILIGHGDWSDGFRSLNPSEPGIYMPLTRGDVEQYQPAAVILGHIHKPMEAANMWYAGSLHPLDINETGRRRYLILDTVKASVKSVTAGSSALYLQESFVLYPGGDEWDRVRKHIRQAVASWNLSEEEQSRARIRIRFTGYTSDKSKLAEIVREAFSAFRFYQDEGPDFSRVSVADDPELEKLVGRVMSAADGLQFTPGPDDPSKEDIIGQALKTIYGTL